MIKTSELRVGNYVRYTSKTGSSFSRITPIDFEYTINEGEDFYFSDSLGISFIPLTPDILEKCGFEKHGRGYFGEGSFLFNQLNFEFYKSELYLCECIEGSFVNSKPIKHLHQLQNLYFALTGEELTVNFSTPSH